MATDSRYPRNPKRPTVHSDLRSGDDDERCRSSGGEKIGKRVEKRRLSAHRSDPSSSSVAYSTRAVWSDRQRPSCPPTSQYCKRRRPDTLDAASVYAPGMDFAPTSYIFEALRFEGASVVRIPDRRNFIAPPWPRRFWASPVFTRDDTELEAKLAAATARNVAAAAAIDNLRAVVDENAAVADRVLDPLERRVAETAAALADLERSAAIAEAADAAADDRSSAFSSDRSAAQTTRDPTEGDEYAVREVQVVKNDPKLRYDTNLSIDMLTVVYASRGASGSAGVSMGTWYRTMQDTLVAEKPAAARRIDYQNGKMSRTFVAAVVASLQSCGRLYVGNRRYTAFEAAALCLYAYSAAVSGSASSKPPGSFKAVLSDLHVYLDELADALSSSGGRPRYAFESSSLPKTTFAAPGGGGRYERDALAGHSVLATLSASRVLPTAPGVLPREGVSTDVDSTETAYDDRVNRAAAALLGRAQTLFLMEDQTLLRSAVDTVTALLLLRRLLWNTNVYADSTGNAFQLGSLLPTGGGGAGASGATAVGASGGTPRDAIKSDGRNFAFLIRNYVLPLYSNDQSVELTQMFPGLVALCLEASVGGLSGPARGTRRRVLDVSSGRANANLLKLVGLELENRGKTNVASVREVIETHDAVTVQYEKGLGAAMQALRPRDALFESGKGAGFNVSSEYDLHYFLCLGYIPKFTSAV